MKPAKQRQEITFTDPLTGYPVSCYLGTDEDLPHGIFVNGNFQGNYDPFDKSKFIWIKPTPTDIL